MVENTIGRQLSVRRHNQKLLTDKPPTRSLTCRVKIIKHRLVGLGHGAPEPVNLEGPHRVSGATPPTLEFAGLVKIANTNPRRELLLLKTDRAAGNRRRGLSTYRLCPNGLRRALTGQPGDLSIQSRDNRRQPLHPLCGSPTNRQPHLLGVLVAEEPLRQSSVPPLHDSLVPVATDPAAPSLDFVLSKELANWPHKFASRVHLQQLGPLQRPPFVDARQGIGDLCCALVSQRLGLLVPRGNVDYGQGVLISSPSHAVVRKEKEVSLMDLVWRPDIKFRSRYAPRRRQVDLPDGLFLQPVLSRIERGPRCRRQLLDGGDSFPVAPGAIINPRQVRVH